MTDIVDRLRLLEAAHSSRGGNMSETEIVAKALCEAEIAPGAWPCDTGMYLHMAEAAIKALDAHRANLSQDGEQA